MLYCVVGLLLFVLFVRVVLCCVVSSGLCFVGLFYVGLVCLLVCSFVCSPLCFGRLFVYVCLVACWLVGLYVDCLARRFVYSFAS